MNPITFNDRIEKALASQPDRKHFENIIKGWQTAPLFDYETSFEKEKKLIPVGTTVSELTDTPWPFDTFRIAMTETSVPYRENAADSERPSTYKTNIVCSRHEGRMFMMMDFRQLGLDREILRMSGGTVVAITTNLEPFIGWTDKDIAYCVFAKHQWALQNDPEGKLQNNAFQPLINGMMCAIGSFLIDVSSPMNHVASVRPNDPRRSVEWIKAHTHYTLITHGHPANSRERSHGERIAVDRKAELKRMSGNRRGHFRTYRHERYTYARGQRRWIKRTWVGPKEWQDEGGKQIYKILEPVEEELEACAA